MLWPSASPFVHLYVALTAPSDVVDAFVNNDGYVSLCELLLAQCVSSAPCCRLDGYAPPSEVQLPLSLYVQSPEKTDMELQVGSNSPQVERRHRRQFLQ